MKKFLIALAVIMISLSGNTQIIQGSIKKNADPTKADIVFRPDYTSSSGEYCLFLQFAVSLPEGVAVGLTATAAGANTFSNMGTLTPIAAYTESFQTPSTADDERVFGWVFANPAVATQSWSTGVDFVGVVVSFNANIPGNIKMLDLNNLGGGDNFNTYFSIVTGGTGGGDRTNYPNLFHSISGFSITGNFPAAQGGDQFVITAQCSGAVGGTASGSTSFCVSGTPTITATGYSGGSGSSYQWISSTVAGDYPNAGTPIAGQTNPASLTTGVATSTTYYWLRVFCSSGLPVANSSLVTVTINPNPIVNCPSVAPVCTNTPPFTLVGGSPAGGTYTGTGVSGGAFNPSAAGAGTHTITYNYSDPSTGCSNSCQFTITVNSLPLVNCPANMTVCINVPPFTLVGGSPGGGIYSGPGVSGGSFNPSAAGSGIHTITYTFTNGGTGCSNSCQFTIKVNATTVTCPSNLTVCVSSPPFTLTGGTPSGGTYSGPGVSGGSFNPSAAGTGVHTITYSYNDPSTGCTSNCQFTITVLASSTVTCPGNMTVCITAPTFPLTGGSPAGGTYTGTGVSGGSFNPSAAGAGTHTITYSFTNACGTTGTCTFTITVTPSVTAGVISGLDPLCIGQVTSYTSSGTPGGSWSSSNPGVASVNASSGQVTALSAGATNITYTVNTGCGSPVSSTKPLTVNQNANAGTVSGASPLCIGETADYSSNGDAGGSWSSANTSIATVNPSTGRVTAVSGGSVNIIYTVSSGCNSPVSALKPLVVNPFAGSISGTSPLCQGSSASFTASGQAGGIWASSDLGVATVHPTTGVVTAVSAGTTNITYTVSGGCPSAATASFALTVNNVPVVNCPANMTVCQNVPAFTLTGGSPSGGTYSGAGVSGGMFNPTTAGAGTHTISYCYADPSTGCTSCCTFTITVDAPPAVTCPANSTICVTEPAYTLTGGSPAGGTYSGTGVSGGQFDPAAAGLGTHTISYCYTDPSTGCIGCCTFTITVAIQITATAGLNGTITPSGTTNYNFGDKPMYTFTPADCYKIDDVLVDGVSQPGAVMSGSYTFGPLDACHTISVSFTLDGPFDIEASSGANGTVTPPGITSVPCGSSLTYTITPDPGFVRSTVLIDGVNNPAAVSSGSYTFMNVHAPHTIHATFVTACSPTTVTISASSADDFCGDLVLTANPATPDSYNYQWYRNGVLIPGATNQTLTLTTASPDGAYTVTAGTSPSCISPESPPYNYTKQNSLHSYTILGTKKVELDENNTVARGSVGNTAFDGEIHIRKNGWVASPGAFVKAKKIKVDNPSNVPIRIFAPATVPLPTMMYNTTSTAGLLNLTVSTNTTVNGNYKDVTIKTNRVVTLTGSIFGKIIIEGGAQVTFTSAVVNLVEMQVKHASGTAYTRVKFAVNCKVKVKNRVRVEERCQINPTGKNVVFYVDAGDFEVKTKNTWVIASIYNPLHKITVHDDGGKPGYMIGRFIAKEINGDAKFVTWDYYDCAAPPPPPPVVNDNPDETDVIVTKLEVQAYPNPTTAAFNLKLKSVATEDVMIRVLSISGKVMQEVKGSPDQIFKVGEGLLPGIYIAELRQGEEKVMVKLVKQ